MPRLQQFILPDLAEGLTEAEILQWMVAVGDTVELNQPFVEVETAKSAVEIPSPYQGVVTEILREAGETVDVGSPIITIDTDPGGAEPASAASAASAAPPAPAESNGTSSGAKIGETTADGRTAVLVGYGAKAPTTVRRPRKGAAPAVPAAQAAPEAAPAPPAPPEPVPAPAQAAPPAGANGSGPALAKPPVRKLAKDLGVDLHALVGTGPHGSITRDDVQSAAAAPAPAAEAATVPEAVPAAAPAAGDRRVPIKGVRKLTAENMVASAFTAPHVTEFLTVDATKTLKLVAKLRGKPEFEGVRVGPLAVLAKGVLMALKRHPMVNSSWDEAAGEIVVKEHVNLGIAAATPRGLIVPNIKAAEAMTIKELAEALVELTATARDGKTAPADMTGGSFTVTNVGVFGVDTGTPILPPGEAAILAFGAIRDQPWVHKGKVVPRKVTTLGLSFDHRIIDGELGSRFLADVGRFLADPQDALLAWS